MFDRKILRLSRVNALEVYERYPVTKVTLVRVNPGPVRSNVAPVGYSTLMDVLDTETSKNNTYVYPLVGNPLLVYFTEPINLYLQKEGEPRVDTPVQGFEIYFDEPEPVVPARSTRSGREYA
jgi:hypothetical protein